MIQGDELFINGDGETSRDFRVDDVRHSQVDISKVANKLGYAPEYRIKDGIAKAIPWCIESV